MSGALQGAVVREGTLRPVIGAYVRMNRLHASGRSSEDVRSVVTDYVGAFFAESLAAGRWTVTLEIGDRSFAQEVQVFEVAISSVVFELPPCPDGVEPGGDASATALGAVRGYAIDVSGRAVADATVTVARAAGSVPDIAPLTGPDGSFAFDALPVGHWLLHALGPSGTSGKAAVEVRGGETGEVTIVLDEPFRPDSGGAR